MTTPISMRLPEGDIAIISRAAEQEGRSRTEFVRQAALRAAEEVLMQRSVVRLPPEEFEAFKAAVSAPGRAAPEMVERLRRKAPWEA